MPRSDPLDARQSGGGGGGGGPPSGSSSAPVEAGGPASGSASTDHTIALAAAPGAPAAVPEHPATLGRPTFRDCAINAVAVVPLLGGSTSSIGGGGGGGGGGSHSLESFASLLDSLRHFAKSSASGDEPEMSQGMRMRAEAGGSGGLCCYVLPAMRVRGFKHCGAIYADGCRWNDVCPAFSCNVPDSTCCVRIFFPPLTYDSQAATTVTTMMRMVVVVASELPRR